MYDSGIFGNFAVDMEIAVAILPIALLFILMLGFKVSGWKSAVITLAVTVLSALFLSGPLGMIPKQLIGFPSSTIVGWSLLEGSGKAVFPILLSIITAIYSYNVLVASGAMETIKEQFSTLSRDRGVLTLIMVWGFGGLLEGMAGFGTAVAIPAAILIGMGFRPVLAAVTALLGNTVATGFGSVGIPVTTLCSEITMGGTPSPETLHSVSAFVILQLTPLFFLVPFAILMLVNRRRWRSNLVIAIITGVASFTTQLLCAIYIGVETPAIVGSIVAIAVLVGYVRITERKRGSEHSISERIGILASLKAWSVYILILIFILLTSKLCPSINFFLRNNFVSTFSFPIIGSRVSFAWLGNAATMILLGSIIGGMIQGLTIKRLCYILVTTIYKLRFTIITVMSLIAMASVMNYSGMIATLAGALVAVSGSAYPLFAPMVGAIGTFVTGSDTSSNILFGKLQAQVAGQLGITGETTVCGVTGNESEWLAAANTAGATGGKMISPQSIAIATGACDMKDSDDLLLRKALPYSLVYILIVGMIVWCLC